MPYPCALLNFFPRQIVRDQHSLICFCAFEYARIPGEVDAFEGRKAGMSVMEADAWDALGGRGAVAQGADEECRGRRRVARGRGRR